MGLVNSNGHSMLHKSAQRGKDDVCQWVFANYPFSLKEESGVDLLQQIAPDAEGCCPSDLAGLEGFENLADWLVCEEKRLVIEAFGTNPCACPSWLTNGVADSRQHSANRYGLDGIFEKGAGVKKMCAHIVQVVTEHLVIKK